MILPGITIGGTGNNCAAFAAAAAPSSTADSRQDVPPRVQEPRDYYGSARPKLQNDLLYHIVAVCRLERAGVGSKKKISSSICSSNDGKNGGGGGESENKNVIRTPYHTP